MFVSMMEQQRPFVELERAGAAIIRESDGRARTISFCSADANDHHLKLMCEFPSVSSINLGRSNVTADGLRRLQKLPQLHSLDLSQTAHGEGVPEVLATLPGLRTLQLRWCPWVTDAALEHLLRIDSLENLMIIGAPITDRGIATLSRFPGLKQVGLDDCSGITDEGLRLLARQQHLESVSVTSCAGITDEGVCALATIPSLRILSAFGIPMRREPLQRILSARSDLDLLVNRFEFPELQPLINIGARMGLDSKYRVRSVEIDDRIHDPESNYPFIVGGQFGNDFATFEGDGAPLVPAEGDLDAVLAVPDVTTLRLKSVPISASGFHTVIPQLKQLRQLVLEDVPVTDDDLRILSQCRSLEVLCLLRVPVTGEGVAALSKLPQLKELSLLSERLTQAGLDAATSLQKLETLAIGDVSLVSSAPQLAGMPNLGSLALVRADLTADDMHVLARAPRLQHLELMHANLPEGALSTMADMEGLETLFLAQCDFDRAALDRLRAERPDLSIFGSAELMRARRAEMVPQPRRLLGGVSLGAPLAPTAVH